MAIAELYENRLQHLKTLIRNLYLILWGLLKY